MMLACKHCGLIVHEAKFVSIAPPPKVPVCIGCEKPLETIPTVIATCPYCENVKFEVDFESGEAHCISCKRVCWVLTKRGRELLEKSQPSEILAMSEVGEKNDE